MVSLLNDVFNKTKNIDLLESLNNNSSLGIFFTYLIGLSHSPLKKDISF